MSNQVSKPTLTRVAIIFAATFVCVMCAINIGHIIFDKPPPGPCLDKITEVSSKSIECEAGKYEVRWDTYHSVVLCRCK